MQRIRADWGGHWFAKVGRLYNGIELTAKTLNKDISGTSLLRSQGVEEVVHMA